MGLVTVAIICSEVLFKKIHYDECVLHALLNCSYLKTFFLKTFSEKIRHFFTGISPIGHVISTDRTELVYHFQNGSSSDTMASMRKKIRFCVHTRDRMRENEFFFAWMTSYNNETTKVIRSGSISD